MFSVRRLFHTLPPRCNLKFSSPSVTDYTVKILASANSGHFADCLKISAQLKSAGMKPDASIYNALMSLAARDASWLFSWAIFDDMLLSGIQPTPTTFAHLVNAQRRRPYTNLWNALDKMARHGVKPNAPVYTAIIQCLVDEGNIEMALQYMMAMKKQHIVPELSAAQAVVILAADCGYSQLAIDTAIYFEQVSLRRLEDSAWIACLASSARNLYLEGVLTCWSRVVDDLNIIPNEGVCMATLNTAARHGIPDLATDVLRVLKTGGVDWQEHHFSALIEAFCRNGQIKEALVTLHIMRKNDIPPTNLTSAFIFDSIKRDIDSLDSTWSVIDEIHASNAGLDIDALNVMIQASIFLGDLQRAIGIYKSFSDYGLSPNLSTFNFLLQGCVGAHHRQLGDILLDDMKQAQVKPNEETYEKMILLCLTQETYEDAFFYLEEMKAAGHVPTRAIYESLLVKCSSVEDARGSMVLQEMKECGYKVKDNTRTSSKPSVVHN